MTSWRGLGMALATLAFGTAAAGESVSGAYLAARAASYDSDFRNAAVYYTQALLRDPGNPDLMEAAALAHLSLGQFSRARPIADNMDGAGLSSQVANMVQLPALVKEGDFDGALARIAEERGIGPLVDGLVSAWAEMGRGDMSSALAGFDKVAEEGGLRSFALYHKALALASVGDFEGAEAIYVSADGASVQMTRRGALARAAALSQLDRQQDALDHLDTAFGSALDPELRDMRTRLANGERLPFTFVRGATDGIAEVFYSIAGALDGEASDDYTILYTRIALYLREDHIPALLMTAGLLDRMERWELSTETYKQVPRDHPAFHASELGRADALRNSGKRDAAIEVLEALSTTHGDLPVVHSTLGDTLRQMERYEEAAAAYDRALSLYDTPSDSQWFLYYARGICYERLKRWPEAEADFRQALALNPDQPQVLNYLGYSLVELNIKLEEALGMIERAVAAQPDSGYIVDSLGWVLYRLGRYEEAVVHMERAAELMPVDPIVNDHLGDVYWAVGRFLEAEFQWNRALSFDPEEKEAERIRRKLEIGLDAVLAEEGAPPLKLANDDG